MGEINYSTKIEDLNLPFEFETESVEGKVHAIILKTPKEDAEFNNYFDSWKDYMCNIRALNFVSDFDGDYTLGQLKREMLEFSPRKILGVVR